MKRRKFLLLGGAIGGGSLAILAHKALTQVLPSESGPLSSDPSRSSAGLGTDVSDLPLSSVHSSPAPAGLFAPPRGDVRIVVISDLNSQYGSTSYEPEVTQAIALIPDWQPDLVLGGGDMVAGQDRQLSRERVQAMWAAFDQTIGAPLRSANIPYGFTIGNHDASRAVGVDGRYTYQQERDLAAAHWNDPRHHPGVQFVDRAQFPFYYTFQQQDIFYLVWDASSGSRMPPEQLAWVERSLGSDVAQAAKMRIVIGHLPLYAVAVNRNQAGEILSDAEALRSLLERYSVHTYISGHHHAYFPGHRGQLELLHAGALGGGPRQLLNSSLPPRKTLTVIDVSLASETTAYTTYDMQNLEVINHQQLPRLIMGQNGAVLRQDVGWDDLTPSEQSACLQTLDASRCQT